MQPVVLVGASGYLGRALLARFVAAGDSVISVGRTGPTAGQVPHIHAALEADGAVEALAPVLREARPRAIIAAHGAPPEADANLHQRVTLTATRKLLAVAKGLPGCRFIGFGSAAEYGLPGSDLPLHESTPRLPLSAYGQAKAAVMDAIAEAAAGGQDAVGLRLFSLIGGRMPERTLLGTVQRQLATGAGGTLITGSLDGARDFLPMTSAVDAVLHVLGAQGLPPCINLGSGLSTPLRALVREVLRLDRHWTTRNWTLHEAGPRGAMAGQVVTADIGLARDLGLPLEAPDLSGLAALVRMGAEAADA